MTTPENDRRHFLKTASAIAGSSVIARTGLATLGLAAPAVVLADDARPRMSEGIQFGDQGLGRTLVWSRTDRPSRMFVQYAMDESFRGARTLVGPHALDLTDYTARLDLTNLPADRDVFVKVWFEDLTNARARSEPVTGQFRTPGLARDIRFVWGGDTAGQGWGINESFGGMKIYEAMRRAEPDFFIHSGNTIYADGPIAESVTAEDGRLWTNIVTPEVAKVAETLAEFRGRYKYNLMDANVRRFNAEVPQIWQWDDHEVTNNWSASKDLSADARYTVKDVPLLIARGSRAFQEFAPMRPHTADESERVYRHIPYGPLLDVFVVDMRSYRGPNTFNRQQQEGDDTAFLGLQQMEWLRQGLERSRATWKVIAADMPVGVVIGDGRDAERRSRYEGLANGNGPALGRELEIARLLTFISRENIRNVVWVTADVHYCAAHHYDPTRAQYRDFAPFWEFVAGPLNAGSFGPNTLDDTFGPQAVFTRTGPRANASPYAGAQFFGEVNIAQGSRNLTVDLKNIDGVSVYRNTLVPA
jgi:alkaline phosphatase D